MKKTIKSEKKLGKSFFIFMAILFLLISFGVYKTINNRKELNQNFEYTNGTITKKYYLANKGYYVHYKYIANSSLYNRSCKLTFDEKIVNIGDKFEVKYSPMDPSNSYLIFDRRIEED